MSIFEINAVGFGDVEQPKQGQGSKSEEVYGDEGNYEGRVCENSETTVPYLFVPYSILNNEFALLSNEESAIKKITMPTEAILSSVGEYTSFTYGGHVIRFGTSPYLERYTKVLEWDNGYIVVMAKYTTVPEEVEEYIDLIPILQNLYFNPDEFLAPIKEVKIKYV